LRQFSLEVDFDPRADPGAGRSGMIVTNLEIGNVTDERPFAAAVLDQAHESQVKMGENLVEGDVDVGAYVTQLSIAGDLGGEDIETELGSGFLGKSR
jgi:hypothetical protein